MKILNNKFHLVLPVLSILVVTSCSDGLGGLAGIGGSGYISSGTITGFGSVFVNGVEFETTSSSFEVDDIDGTQQDLRIGMVVQIQGSINSDGVTGIATHIQYTDDLQGPISQLEENDDLTEKTLTVLGKSVVISRLNTSFENSSYELIAIDNIVEVSGYYDQNGVLQASFIELQPELVVSDDIIVEVKGEINALSGNEFNVLGIQIDASSANLENLPDGLQEGVLVDIRGIYNEGNGTFTASEVEAEDYGFSDSENIEIEGFITRYVSNSDFDINGQAIDASEATLSPADLQLEAGIKVEAEGSVSNGILVASEVGLRGGNAQISAKVDSIDFENNRFTVQVLAGQPSITVQLTTATRMEDEAGDDDHLTLIELEVGDFVEVRGFESAANKIEATQVKRESEAKEIQLQGVVSSQVENESITVLGIVFPIDPFTTSFENINEMDIVSSNFISGIIVGQTVVSIVYDSESGVNVAGVADEVEIVE